MKKSNLKKLASNTSDEWETPQELYDQLDFIYTFTLDVCASAVNHKCARYFDNRSNGLSQSWRNERCWMNPPYGRVIGKWMRKAYEESLLGAHVVCLIPARTDTAWWHDYAVKGQIELIRGRLKFKLPGKKGNGTAPFPSALVTFHPFLTNRDVKQENKI